VLYSMGNTYLHRLALFRQRAYHKVHCVPLEPDMAKVPAAIAPVLLLYRGSILGGSPDSVDILFYEVPARHWATGGELWSDKQKK
jgi:hypothetical protein